MSALMPEFDGTSEFRVADSLFQQFIHGCLGQSAHELLALPALDLGCQAFDGDVGSGVFGQNFSEFRSQALFVHACEELVRQRIQESITLTCVRRCF